MRERENRWEESGRERGERGGEKRHERDMKPRDKLNKEWER